MGADEKFVREHWAHVRSWVRDLDSYGTDQFNVALYYREDDAKYGGDYFQRWQEDCGKEDAVWSAAAKFTWERKKQITLFNWDLGWVKEHGASATLLALIEEKLAELKRGMR